MRSVTVAPRRRRARAVSAAAASSSARAEAADDLGEIGAGEHQRGGAVERGDERGGGAPFERRAQRLGALGGQRVAEQGGAARAGQARGEGGGLGDVRVAGLRCGGGRRDERDGRRVQRAAVEHPGDRAARRAREQLAALDRAEPVPVEHPHDPHPVARERAQRRPQPPQIPVHPASVTGHTGRMTSATSAATAVLADAVAGYASRFHAAVGARHHVASPLGAWLLLALIGDAGDGPRHARRRRRPPRP